MRSNRQVAKKMTPQVSILMPLRDEGMNLKALLNILRAVVFVSHEVILLTDKPHLDTELETMVNNIASKYDSPIRIQKTASNAGIVQMLQTGISTATGDYILIFAVDEVGPVLAINDMVSLAQQGCDFVSCTRYAYGGRRLGGSWLNATLSRLANMFFHRLSGMVLSDATTGIKLFRRGIFDDVIWEAKPLGWAITFEMSIKAQLMGLQMGEVPIISIDRLYGGTTNFSLWSASLEYLRWFWYGIWKLRWRSNANQNTKAIVRIPTEKSLLGGQAS